MSLINWTNRSYLHQTQRLCLGSIAATWSFCNFNSLTDYLSAVQLSGTLISDGAIVLAFLSPVVGCWKETEAAFSSCPKISLCVTLNQNDWWIDFPSDKSMHSYSCGPGRSCTVVLRNCLPKDRNSVIICSACRHFGSPVKFVQKPHKQFESTNLNMLLKSRGHHIITFAF